MRIWDISPPIKPGIPVWPGDTDYSEEQTWEIEGDCPVRVSSVTFSTHTGSHADAPSHYDADGIAIGAVALDKYLGPCRIVDARRCGGLVTLANVADALDGAPPRVLFRTYDTAPQETWDPDFTALDPALIEHLAGQGGVLVGLDTPSIDPQESKTLDAHHTVRRAGMAILEGVVLDAIAPGEYELIALPLKLANLDGSPVRAILRELP